MTEAELCSAFIASATKPNRNVPFTWTAYPETAGFDILMVRSDGVQIGIEAKLSLNPRVLVQALPAREGWLDGTSAGPDYLATLVPSDKCNSDVERLCKALGVTVLRCHPKESCFCDRCDPPLPHDAGYSSPAWFDWAPAVRCPVPDYIPDVEAGHSAPVALTPWKIKAIRLSVLLEERAVTRADFRALQLSPTNWLCPRGWLERSEAGWARCERTPDFERQHPTNYAQIRADKPRWAPASNPDPAVSQRGGSEHGLR